MYTPTVIGVDPGIVHTGIVFLDFDTQQRELTIKHAVVDGLDAPEARQVITGWTGKAMSTLDIFIEEYRPRSGFGVNQQMMVANAEFKSELGGTLRPNTGVTKVVSRELMELCHVWSFSTTTHHQDLRSAARIALLGMMLEPALNKVLYTYATDNIDGRDWNVQAN